MPHLREVVITGLGVVGPLGSGREEFWNALVEGRSGVRPLSYVDERSMPVYIGGEVADFHPADIVKPRKNLKVMSRESQMAVVAAGQAAADAGLVPGGHDPERLGVVFGCDLIQCDPVDLADAVRACLVDGRFDFRRWGTQAMSDVFPLWFLKLLPNMPACHIGIAHDARGPNNSITLADVSGLLAVGEAAAVIRRGQADAMLCGAVGTRIQPTLFARAFAGQLSRRNAEPARACRPFDFDRDGQVGGEGAAAFVLEAADHAAARGARPLCRVLSQASAHEPACRDRPSQGTALRQAMTKALRAAGRAASDIGHVNAHGLSTTAEDRVEAAAIRDVLGDAPVFAPKSYFGNLGSGAGAVEMAASVLALTEGRVPPSLNYERPDPACPINVVRGRPLEGAARTAMLLNFNLTGQAAALLLAR